MWLGDVHGEWRGLAGGALDVATAPCRRGTSPRTRTSTARIGRLKKSGNDSDPNFLTAPVTPVGVAADAGKPAHVTGLSRVAGKRGSLVVVRGRNFGARRGSGTVRFGSASCGRYVSWSDHRILVAVPAKAPAGRVKLVVQTTYGPSDPQGFTVQR